MDLQVISFPGTRALRLGAPTRQVRFAYLARIDQVNHAGPELNAIIETNVHALEQAYALDKERRTSGKRSALHGIPILVKDSIGTLASEGMNTTAGSYSLLGSIVRDEATVVAKGRNGVDLYEASIAELQSGLEIAHFTSVDLVRVGIYGNHLKSQSH
ncbi:unnamed protein product [Rhizoctonia solani]|uniref:Amidase domain-containing protein n=1 Tax=Rhizoctonia solani TaxID=456999 RepID=A0A8H3C2D9_9AGAM|nr:unnamed protein product [Rhizoctonia solani]